MLLTELLQQKPLRDVTFADIDSLNFYGEYELLGMKTGLWVEPPNTIEDAIVRILQTYNYCITRGDDISEENLQLLNVQINALSVIDGNVSGLVARFHGEVETIRDNNRRIFGQS